MENKVVLKNCDRYDEELIFRLLDDEVFSRVKSAEKIVLKPNWVRECHQEKSGEWEYVITHPTVITAVLRKVADLMSPGGRISIIDGPEFSTDINKLLSYYPVDLWRKITQVKHIDLEIIDLREEIWEDDGNVVTKRQKNIGDPRGTTQVNLKEKLSEFYNHHRSKKGYYGADSDIGETNSAHNGIDNYYRLSRTAIEADVFINLPKLKTHKKAGITCSLKNLVGINTYRNFLPHCSLGLAEDGGDQFASSGSKQRIEGMLMPVIHQHIRTSTTLSKLFSPFLGFGKKVFGNNKQTIRGGSWFGNDTIWRMILDINKALLYSEPDGSLRKDQLSLRKSYISVIDAIFCGEKNGPKIPDPKFLGCIIQGNNPVPVDAVCAEIMGFDHRKIPSISNAFKVGRYPLFEGSPGDIRICTDDQVFTIDTFPEERKVKFIPAKGWIDHIERCEFL